MSSAAWIVIEAMVAEIEAQMNCGTNAGCVSVCDCLGRIHIHGTIDLAALAAATELALCEAYPAPPEETVQ